MRSKLFILLAVIGLVLSACGGDDGAGGTATSTAPDTTVGAEQPEEILLSYDLAAGDTYVYDVAIDQEISLQAEGEGSALGDEEIPGQADVNITGEGTFTFEVADGPQPDTYEVTITGDFDDLTVTGTVDGEDISSDLAAGEEAPDFASLEPVSMTVIVDEQGNVIPGDPAAEDPFGGMFGGLESLAGDALPGAQVGQFFGPPFGDEAVTVGDTWSTSFDTPGFGEETITTSVDSAATGTDTINGVDVLVVETTSTTSAFEFDLGEFFIALFAGFMPEDPLPEEQAEIDALVENLRFVIRSDESTANSTTYFDAAAGITRMFEVSSAASMGFDVNFPDEETGELSGFLMDMEISQTITHSLVSGPTA
jgi:hypothetical protein